MPKERAYCSLVLTLLVLSSGSGAAGAGKVTVVHRFDGPRIVRFDNGFDRIFFPSTRQAGKPGEPAFPFRGVRVLLPEKERAVSASIRRIGWTPLDGSIRLHPEQLPSTFEDPAIRRPFLVNSAAYERDEWIDPPASGVRTDRFRGHAIATMAFTPVSFNPAAGTAGYYSEVEITFETIPDAEEEIPAKFLRRDPATVEWLRSLIDNPDQIGVSAVPRAAASGEGQYDYLIVAREGLAASFGELAAFYEMRGLRTSIITVEEIETSYSGSDLPEKIRNAIIDQYSLHGIERVLLAGDGDPSGMNSVPFRGLYCAVQSSTLYEDYSIPADIYYSNLDGNWNADGDSKWGEPGEDDLFAEISVGRASVDAPVEAAAFMHKSVSYQESPVVSQARSALMLGEKLYNDPLTYGGDELDQLIDTCSAYGFFTSGIPPDFDITKYYDRDLGTWPKSNVISAVNSGTGWICHAGHSNASYVMRLSIGDVTEAVFTNDGVTAAYPLVYTYGCYAGAFDVDDCIAEKMIGIGTFASAILCNSRYGWFTEGTTNGPSHHFQREFVDAVFSEGITVAGDANRRSKDETVPFLDLPDEYEPGAHRWCFYTLNLLGDPAMDIWTDAPSPIYASHASSTARGDSVFEADTDAPGSTGALGWNGTCYGSSPARADGSLAIPLPAPLPLEVDSLILTISAHNRVMYRDTVTVADVVAGGAVPGAVTLGQNNPNPFNPSTLIYFSIPERGPVTLRVFDAAGREVDRVLDSEMEAGAYTITWRPRGLASGMYFYLLEAGGQRICRKAVLLK